MKISIFLFFLIFTEVCLAETLKVHIPGMVCPMCLHGMRTQFKSAVKDVETDVTIDIDKKILTVKTLKPMTNEEVKKRVIGAGYESDKITRLEE